MKYYAATPEEYIELWESVCELWDKLSKDANMIDAPWSEYGFKCDTFKVLIRQKGYKAPEGLH